jgi:hypothetical protein
MIQLIQNEEWRWEWMIKDHPEFVKNIYRDYGNDYWTSISGESAQFGVHGAFTEGDGKDKPQMPSEALQVYEGLSKILFDEEVVKVNTGYAYDRSYYNDYGSAHSGLDLRSYSLTTKSATNGEVVFIEEYDLKDGVYTTKTGYWVAIDEIVNDKKTGRRWWYGHFDTVKPNISVGYNINEGEDIGADDTATGSRYDWRHHLHLTVVRNRDKQGVTLSEVRNGRGSSYDNDVSDVIKRTLNPLHAYWMYKHGIAEL